MPVTTVLVAAFRQCHRNRFDLGRARLSRSFTATRRVTTGLEQHHPRSRVATDDGFDALAIVPARGPHVAANGFERGDMGVDTSVQTMRHSRQDAHEAGSCGRENQIGRR